MTYSFIKIQIIIVYTRKIFFYTSCIFYDNMRIFEMERKMVTIQS